MHRSLNPRSGCGQALLDPIEPRLRRFEDLVHGVDDITQDAIEERLDDLGLGQLRNASGEQPTHAVRIIDIIDIIGISHIAPPLRSRTAHAFGRATPVASVRTANRKPRIRA
jgi:hypothetical protein